MNGLLTVTIGALSQQFRVMNHPHWSDQAAFLNISSST
jgi:hypothetical protein